MNLVFFDRRSAAQPAPGEAFLNVQPGGACLLSSGAVANHQLQEQRWVSVAQDTDTNRFFLVFGAGNPESKPFALRSQKNKPSVRTFSAAGAARKLCDAFGLGEAKSLRLAVGQPVPFKQQQLFPLQLEGAAPVVVPAAAAPEPAPAPIAEASETAPAEAPAPAEQDAPAAVKRTLWTTAETDYLRQHFAATPIAEMVEHLGREEHSIRQKASTLKLKRQPIAPSPTPVATPAAQPLAAVPEQAEQPRKTFGLQARAEELTNHWKERELNLATPNELGEVLNLLRHVSRDKRGFEMDLVLERAEKEHTERLKGAGKGGNRG